MELSSSPLIGNKFALPIKRLAKRNPALAAALAASGLSSVVSCVVLVGIGATLAGKASVTKREQPVTQRDINRLSRADLVNYTYAASPNIGVKIPTSVLNDPLGADYTQAKAKVFFADGFMESFPIVPSMNNPVRMVQRSNHDLCVFLPFSEFGGVRVNFERGADGAYKIASINQEPVMITQQSLIK